MTNPVGIPQAVQSLIASHITSVTQLEALLLLHRQAHRTWSSLAVAKELRIDPDAAEHQLRDLCGRGFFRQATEAEETVYRYRPDRSELDWAVQRLAETYRSRGNSIIRLIFSKPLEHIRTFTEESGATEGPAGDQ